MGGHDTQGGLQRSCRGGLLIVSCQERR
ncbi:hypothetical protein FHS00_003467 [Limimaricola variabilis]|uniref:Uncharacterized protein n=1 Tax=Limimaricola variabilis TaxID=1492771 RepID=A0ABR6HTG7_9RHOB|nr:hypothetical protein [Limimaricola variabilis]